MTPFKKLQDEFTELPISAQMKLKRRRRKKGLCFDCPRVALEGYSRCEVHLGYQRKKEGV